MARFVRLGEEAGGLEHLTPPLVLVSPSKSLQLGYNVAAEGYRPAEVEDGLLVSRARPRSLVIPLAEGALGLSLMLLLLSALTDLTAKVHTNGVGAGLSAAVGLLGLQAMRGGNRLLLLLFSLLLGGLLLLGLVGVLPGLLSHALLLSVCCALGLVLAKALGPLRFVV
jgi:hypothetical protein